MDIIKVRKLINEVIESVASEIATDPTYYLSKERVIEYVDEWFCDDSTEDILDSVKGYIHNNWKKIESDIYTLVDKWNDEN